MTLETPPGYAPLSDVTLPDFLAAVPALATRLGGSPADWRVTEVGDGNLNLVFLVEGPGHDGKPAGLCVKQSLPYLRLVGEGWPLDLNRAWFEQRAMALHAAGAAGRAPALLHYDPTLYAIVMERLSPHIILRRGLVQGVRYPRLAEHISDYLAGTLHATSDLALPASKKRPLVAAFTANDALCRLTEDVIFTQPYMTHPHNRWTSPQLDTTAKAVRADTAWKLAASRLKLKFMASPEALIHGDLHTGSIMVTETDTRVIDPEFAFFGPMGFDVGAIIGNLLLNYLSQDGHATEDHPRDAYQDWVLETVEQLWTLFRAKFLHLWRTSGEGDAYPAALFTGPEGTACLETERRAYLDRLFTDALGYAGAKITRRILGLAHNIDLEKIADPDMRALCETRCLALARSLMVETGRYPTIKSVTEAARHVRRTVTAVGPIDRRGLALDAL
ncbi:S-methyl-5-thioribose kinase [Nitrospirillum sp. BR 11163]|uniref:S-methyl-5-thioribose kinase n=1 Tax=Nitrospirillum sp. BR 11163 TaxID=3104323 RepID=UPI002AFDFC9A|nr:S-methyl-5-thioribose kinase [Nitrospirillum sp. BR 11163]MEA1677618.1 S-methyl-5-thioribose kinase [Nitrospirillum sp. BR 11163]